MVTSAELVELLAAVARGDAVAFERLYEATRAKLFGVVLRILRRPDLAEGVVQDSYVKIWTDAGQYNPAVSSPIVWMVALARSRAIDLVRKQMDGPEKPEIEVGADMPAPLARQDMTEDLKQLLECVEKLDPERQKLILLAYYNGWSRAQLAAKFDMPEHAVRSTLRRSLIDMRACLGVV